MKIAATLCCFVVVTVTGVFSQAPTVEQIPAVLTAGSLGSKEIEIIREGTNVYLPALDAFTFLGIPNETTLPAERLEGAFKNRSNRYTIDFTENRARIAEKSVALTRTDYIIRNGIPYLNVDFFGNFFGVALQFNERRLTVEVRRPRELPAYVTLLNRRRLLQQAKGGLKIPEPEFYLGHEPTVVGGGRLDWLSTTQFYTNQFIAERYTLNYGMQFLGGDLSARLVGVTENHRSRNELHGQFRIPFLNNTTLTQIVGGDLYLDGVQPRLITGLQITNQPLARRFLFTREPFRGQFEPQSDLEVYGTITGTGYQQTDKDGFYQFDAPVYYGEGLMEIHAYDPWGMEQVVRYRLVVPRTMIPAGQTEYSLAVGRTGRPTYRLASLGSLLWGVSSALTVGAKYDYYDLENINQKFYPTITATTRLAWNLVFNAAVSPGALSQGSLSWMSPSSMEFSLQGFHYDKNDFFNPAQIVNRLISDLRIPLDLDTYYHILFDVSGTQTEFSQLRERELQMAMSSIISSFSLRISSILQWSDDYSGNYTNTAQVTRLDIGLYMPAGLILQAEGDYNHLQQRVETLRGIVSKRFPSSLEFSVSYLRSIPQEYYNIGLRVSYYFPFMRAQATANTSGNGRFEYGVYGSGSIAFNPIQQSMYFENRPNYVGYGGFVAHPFFDANNNGIQDPGEELITKGRVYLENITRGTRPYPLRLDRLFNDRLPFYEDYEFFLDPVSLDNPIWVPLHSSMRMLSEPNLIRRVDIPVVNGGTVRGSVIIDLNGKKPAEDVRVTLKAMTAGVNPKVKFSKTVTTFSTGEFEFTGLAPGQYQVGLDDTQLQDLGYRGQPMSREVEVTVKPDGDIIEKVDFTLLSR